MNSTVSCRAMRDANVYSVFDCIRRNTDAITKREIQQQTTLSWGSISFFISRLLALGIISERSVKTDSPGRNAVGYAINTDHNLIMGIDVNVIGISAVLIDLKSYVHHQYWQELNNLTPEGVISQLKEIVCVMMSKIDNPQVIKGIGLSFSGYLDTVQGISIRAQQFGSFQTLNIVEILEQQFGIDVILEHDPNCMALSEKLIGCAQDIDSFLFVRLSKGIGMGIVIDGEIYRGYKGATGEIGHTTIHPDGERCYCGNTGCLETYSSSDAILRRCEQARQQYGLPFGPLTTLGEAAVASAQNQMLRDIFQKAAEYAGIAIANAINLLDPQAVILGGELVQEQEMFLDRMMNILQSRVFNLHPVDIRVTSLGDNSAAIGAASLFIQRVFLGAVGELDG